MDAKNRLLKKVNTAIMAIGCSMLIEIVIVIIRAHEIQIEESMGVFDIYSFMRYIRYVLIHDYSGMLMITFGLTLIILLIKKRMYE